MRMCRRWHAFVPNIYLAWVMMTLKVMGATGITDAIKITSGSGINVIYALVFSSMLLLAAQFGIIFVGGDHAPAETALSAYMSLMVMKTWMYEQIAPMSLALGSLLLLRECRRYPPDRPIAVQATCTQALRLSTLLITRARPHSLLIASYLILRAARSASKLAQGSRWHFFISHYQKNAGALRVTWAAA